MQRGPCYRGGPCNILGKEVTRAQNTSWSYRSISDCGGRCGDEDEDNTARLSNLIALVEAGFAGGGG
jgi:hypothetical protein